MGDKDLCKIKLEQKGEGFMEVEGVLDIKDACRILKISQPNIRQKVYRGEIPFIKLGRRVLFKAQDIAALIEKSYRPAKTIEQT